MQFMIGGVLLIIAAFLGEREKRGASRYQFSRAAAWTAIAIMAKDAF